MFFWQLTGLLCGGTLIYAGLKGEGEKINGVPVYSAPWLLLIAPFEGATVQSSQSVGLATDADGQVKNVDLVTHVTVDNPFSQLTKGFQSLAQLLQKNLKKG